MKTEEKIKWFTFGAVSLLFVKYVLVGLDDWDSVLHPNRIEAKDTPIFFRKGLILSESDINNSYDDVRR